MDESGTTEQGTSASTPSPTYLDRYVAEIELWRQEIVAARAERPVGEGSGDR